MARSEEQNRVAREKTREGIISAAIDLFAERGVRGATIAEITNRAGVAQGLLNYHFGGKDAVIGEVIDRWFRLLISFPMVPGADADERLGAIIDGSLAAAAANLSLHRAVLAMQQDPTLQHFFAEAAVRNAEDTRAAEEAVAAIFSERGAVDPAFEETMLRASLEGVVVKYATLGPQFSLEAARDWVRAAYGLGPGGADRP